ncbi:hypothetical protein [Mesorhizobium sp. AA23]|uniref:hypothetical protein n=1 Tax=Mesorhizobium sp. AA23 TaxID=1854058 RepID=UPI0018D33A6A|nr:hypothetical protein [Mesorhizobium sp. AA23]
MIKAVFPDQQGNAVNAILVAACNFSLLLRWLKVFSILIALLQLRPKAVAA